MAKVSVTGNAWDHTGNPLPATLQPELWFRPEGHDISGNALLAGVEAKATLNLNSGAFTVDLMAEPWLRYRPHLRWLLNPNESSPEKWSYGWATWDWTINPYPNGGPIGNLDGPNLDVYSVLVSLAPPPPGYKGWYLNAAGPGNPPGDPDDPLSSGTGILEIVS